jgi:hypothetical protein
MTMTVRSGLLAVCLAAGGLFLAPADGLAQKKQRDLITREEVLQSGQRDMDLQRAVRSLRPHFLAAPRGQRTMGAAPPGELVLYIDGSRSGDLNGLKEIAAKDVQEVRYLEPSKAQERYGISHSGGAILVTLFKGPKPPQ